MKSMSSLSRGSGGQMVDSFSIAWGWGEEEGRGLYHDLNGLEDLFPPT